MNEKSNRIDWGDIKGLFGFVLIIIGLVWVIGLTIYLAITDIEFAKHSESLYATIIVIKNWGLIPMVMMFAGYCMLKSEVGETT